MSDETTEYMIGTSVLDLVFLESLNNGDMPYPDAQFAEFVTVVELASGHEKGLGLPTAQWTFGLVSQAQRDALRVYCPGVSSDVVIKTRTNDNGGEYKLYSAIMKWPKPDGELYDAGRYKELTILFQYMEEITGLY